jgi:hypothetical protein
LYTFTEAVSGASTVEIRFTPRQFSAGSTGNLHIDLLRVEGAVVPIPEPSTAVLALLAMFALPRLRSRFV